MRPVGWVFLRVEDAAMQRNNQWKFFRVGDCVETEIFVAQRQNGLTCHFKKTDLIRLSMMFSYLSYLHRYIIYIYMHILYIYICRRHFFARFFSGHFFLPFFRPIPTGRSRSPPGHCSFTVPEGKVPKASAFRFGGSQLVGLVTVPVPPWFIGDWVHPPEKRFWNKRIFGRLVFFLKKK